MASQQRNSIEMSGTGEWKPLGAPGGDAQIVVDAFHRPVGHPGVEVREDAGCMLADGPRELDEGRQAGPCLPLQPLVEQLLGILRRALPKDRCQVSFNS